MTMVCYPILSESKHTLCSQTQREVKAEEESDLPLLIHPNKLYISISYCTKYPLLTSYIQSPLKWLVTLFKWLVKQMQSYATYSSKTWLWQDTAHWNTFYLCGITPWPSQRRLIQIRGKNITWMLKIEAYDGCAYVHNYSKQWEQFLSSALTFHFYFSWEIADSWFNFKSEMIFFQVKFQDALANYMDSFKIK